MPVGGMTIPVVLTDLARCHLLEIAQAEVQKRIVDWPIICLSDTKHVLVSIVSSNCPDHMTSARTLHTSYRTPLYF